MARAGRRPGPLRSRGRTSVRSPANCTVCRSCSRRCGRCRVWPSRQLGLLPQRERKPEGRSVGRRCHAGSGEGERRRGTGGGGWGVERSPTGYAPGAGDSRPRRLWLLDRERSITKTSVAFGRSPAGSPASRRRGPAEWSARGGHRPSCPRRPGPSRGSPVRRPTGSRTAGRGPRMRRTPCRFVVDAYVLDGYLVALLRRCAVAFDDVLALQLIGRRVAGHLDLRLLAGVGQIIAGAPSCRRPLGRPARRSRPPRAGRRRR